MNRDIWFRILQIAVVAPYIYSLSEKQNAYFKLGLKLVAGSIVIMNAGPLFQEARPYLEAALQMKASADRLTAQAKANAIEGEFTPAPDAADTT